VVDVPHRGSNLSAEYMAKSRASFAADTAWMAATRTKLKEADGRLDAAFAKLLPN